MNFAFVFMAIATWFAYLRRLRVLCEPVLWKVLLYALPSVWFAINLVVFYAMWWWVYLTSPEGTTARQVGRNDIFDEIEWGPYETAPAVLYAGILTLVLILIARALAGRSTSES